MKNTEKFSFGDPDFCKASAKYRATVQEILDPEHNGYKDVNVNEVFAVFGYKEVDYSELPEAAGRAVSDRRKEGGSMYGLPLSKIINSNEKWPENNKVMANDDFSIICFVSDHSTRNPYGHVSWSILAVNGGEYEMRGINHDSHIADVAYYLSAYEARREVASQVKSVTDNT